MSAQLKIESLMDKDAILQLSLVPVFTSLIEIEACPEAFRYKVNDPL